MLRLAGDETRLPLLIHCTAGKDRTGFAASLIQLLLGADPEAIMQGYLASNDLLSTYQQEMQQRMKSLPRLGISLEKFLPLFEARPEYLQAAWDLDPAGVRQPGGIFPAGSGAWRQLNRTICAGCCWNRLSDR